MTDHTTPIPQLPTRPLVQNLLDMDPERPVQRMVELARTMGPIYRLRLPPGDLVLLSNHALIAEALDTARFVKAIPTPLVKLRALAGEGLFTADNDAPNWSLAHRILMPAFGQEAMAGYYESMLDVGLQMVDRWSRLEPGEAIEVVDDMSRLTLDIIALCGFNHRLNSFYRETAPPFIQAMTEALEEAMMSSNRPELLNLMAPHRRARFERNLKQMHSLVEQLIQERRQAMRRDPDMVQRDLMGLMLSARDPMTGQRLDDRNVRDQVVTFLIAGHETTSALLSFTLYQLAEHPELCRRAQAEVDEVVGGPQRLPAYADLRRLTFIDQLLNESLRLWSPAPAFFLTPVAPTLLGGRYKVEPGEQLVVLLRGLHRDPEVWGEDPDRFDPSRFDPERVAARPPTAFKPFGNGARACIGRQFAIQEARMAVALILQRFNLHLADPDYKLQVRESLTFKPEGLRLRLTPRFEGGVTLVRGYDAPGAVPAQRAEAPAQAPAVVSHGSRLAVAYGSNMGSTRQLAERFAAEGRRMGYEVRVAPLDAMVALDPRSQEVLTILTASYNGFAPDNAAAFEGWAQGLDGGALDGHRHLIFGCGHRDWASTWQAVPRRLDEALEKAGSQGLVARGEGDAREDLVADFEGWCAAAWPALHAHFGVTALVGEAHLESGPGLEVEVLEGVERPGLFPTDARPMRVLANVELAHPHDGALRSRRHVALALPEGVSYEVGDHLVVMPVNDPAVVERFAEALGWDLDRLVVLRTSGAATLPLNRPVALRALLERHLELRRSLTRRQIAALAPCASCPPERVHLQRLADDADAFEAEITARGLTLEGLLFEFPSCRPSMAQVLELLPSLEPRTYSIASDPASCPGELHLTVAVVRELAWSGHGVHLGVCSNHLAHAEVGRSVMAAVRSPDPVGRLRDDPRRPLVMVGAGTGLAPLRGVLQSRARRAAAGQQVPPAALFFGCRHPEVDWLYRDELEAWVEQGVVSLHMAFSRPDEGDGRYVQDALLAEGDQIARLLEEGALVLLCGDGRKMAPAVREALKAIQRKAHGPEADVEAWYRDFVAQGRLLEDTWAG